MTNPASIADSDQYLAKQRDLAVAHIAALLNATRGQTIGRQAAAIYDAGLAPILAGNDRALLAIRDALRPYPAAFAAVQVAINALPRPDGAR